MQVTKLKVNNFQGLVGVQEFEFGKITALAQPNGSGKTSLINALRYGLTGVEPSGTMITQGQASTAVRVEFENGSNFLRQKFAEKGKSSKYYVGSSQTTLTKLNSFITHEMGGVEISTAKTISSGELLTSMTSQQFGEMLLQYLPEAMTVQTVIERFPSANKEQIEVIKECLPAGEFGIEKINDFYKLLVERRKAIKQSLVQKEAVLASLGEEAPVYTSEQLKSEIEALMKQRDEIVALEANARFYHQVEQQIKQRDEQVALLDKQIAEMQADNAPSGEEVLISEQIADLYKQFESIQSVMKAFVKIKKAMDQAASKLTDADKVELLEAAKEVVPMYTAQKERLVVVQTKVAELNNRKEVARSKTAELKQAQLAEKAKFKEQLLAQDLKLPEKVEISVSRVELDRELARLQNLLPIVENYSKKDKLVETIAKYTKKHADYDGLVTAFSPKGEVKEAITSYYMDEFADPCNAKAQKLFPGMSLKFVTDKGVKVLTDPNGSGHYLEFASLSGGEQASVMFLLVSMLTSLSGMGIIILDELSVLDDEVFENLIRVLKENEDEYDMCLIASVDHVGTIATLNKYQIPIISVNQDKMKAKKREVFANYTHAPEVVAASAEKAEVVLTNEEQVGAPKVPNFEDVADIDVAAFELDVDNLSVEEDSQASDGEQESEEILPPKQPVYEAKLVPKESEVQAEESDKAASISALKDLMNQTMEEAAEMRFVPDDSIGDDFLDGLDEDDHEEATEESKESENEEEEMSDESLISLGLHKGKPAIILNYVLENVNDERIFEGTAKDISEALSISQPTVGKVLKTMQDSQLIISLRRGLWQVSETLLD